MRALRGATELKQVYAEGFSLLDLPCGLFPREYLDTLLYQPETYQDLSSQ
jgi:hypothetical protein